MKFAHIADTHIRNLKYHYEYRVVFEQLYEKLREQEVDYIVHCGDIAHTKTQISPEFVEMCANFLDTLSDIAPTYVILGNHDGNLRNSSRQDALTPIVAALDKPDLYLLKTSGETELKGGFTLNVLSVFDTDNWQDPTDADRINIALYHGSISGVKTDIGWTMEHGENDLSIFNNFDYGFLGDIHKTNQTLDEEGRMRYPGSTVQQNHGETNNKGFLVWNIEDKLNFTCTHHVLENPKPFVTIELTAKGRIPKGTDVTPAARIRLVSNNNLPLDRMRRAVDVAKTRFRPESITFLNRASGDRGSIDDLANDLRHEDLRSIAVQEELMDEYLKDYQVESKDLERIYALNKKYNSMAQENEEVARNINWKLNTLEWNNLFNYGEDNVIDFTNLTGIVGIFGKNFSGKSSIIDSFLYALFNSTSKNVRKNLNIINQTKEVGSGRVELEIANKKYYVERKSEKYIKKLKGEETTEAKTDVEFYSYDEVTQEQVGLNGLTRADTDNSIRRVFGGLDDFLLTSMASQLGSLAFISEGSTRRKEILAKFLDLEVFDKKYKLAKDEAFDLRGAIKRLEGRDFDSEIKEAQQILFENEAGNLKHKNACASIKRKIKKREKKLKQLRDQIAAVPAEPINLDECLSRKQIYIDQRSKIESVCDTNNSEIEQNNLFIERAKRFLRSFDVVALGKTKQIIASKSIELEELTRKIESEKRTFDIYRSRAKNLEGVPCGDQFVTSCKFIKDAYKASKLIDDVETTISGLRGRLNEGQEEILSLDLSTIEDHLKKYDRLLEKKLSAENSNTKIKLDNERNTNQIFSIEASATENLKDIDYYYQNQEAIENFNALTRQVTDDELALKEFENSLEACEEELLELYKSHGSMEQSIKNLEAQKEELLALRQEYGAYDLYMKCMHNNGIAYDIIKKRLPVINNEIAKVLTNIVNFDVFLENDGRKLDIYIKHPRFEPRPLELGSGAEKTISAMAIRLALLNVSSLPKGNIFILDEPGAALDEENMEGFVRILDMVKGYFKTVLLISHLDSLKDCVDTQIVIDKKEGFAYINQ
jgi:DNA repair exonuclease SbcCD ATPase subunit/DNA repair exonuclease SbcCD nuclease subunit